MDINFPTNFESHYPNKAIPKGKVKVRLSWEERSPRGWEYGNMVVWIPKDFISKVKNSLPNCRNVKCVVL